MRDMKEFCERHGLGLTCIVRMIDFEDGVRVIIQRNKGNNAKQAKHVRTTIRTYGAGGRISRNTIMRAGTNTVAMTKLGASKDFVGVMHR